eukprot:scaffold2363_cov159-Amphora_coffeaeformis.AAC.31
MKKDNSTDSRDPPMDESNERKGGSRRFDAPGFSFSMSDGGDDVFSGTRGDSTVQTAELAKGHCNMFIPSSIDTSRRRSVATESAKSKASPKPKIGPGSAPRRNTFGVTATNLFNMLYTHEEDPQSDDQGSRSILDDSVGEQGTKSTSGDTTRSDTNTKSTFGNSTRSDPNTKSTSEDTTITGSTENPYAWGRTLKSRDTKSTCGDTTITGSTANPYAWGRTLKSRDTKSTSGETNMSDGAVLAQGRTLKSHDTKSTSGDTNMSDGTVLVQARSGIHTTEPPTTYSDSESSFIQSCVTKGTTIKTQHAACEPSTVSNIDIVQQALDDLAATPIRHNTPIRGVLKYSGVTKNDITFGLNRIDYVTARDDSSERAIIEDSPQVAVEEDIEIENMPSNAPPVLHRFCLTVTKASDLRKAIGLITTTSAGETDAMGRLPLHCFSDNAALADAVVFPDDMDMWPSSPPNGKRLSTTSSPTSHCSHSTRRRSNRGPSRKARASLSPSPGSVDDLEETIIDFAVNGLLTAYPAAMITPDGNGKVPFEAVITEWVEQSLELPDQNLVWGRKRNFSAEQFPSVTALWQRGSSLFAKNRQDSTNVDQEIKGVSNSTESSGASRDIEGGKVKNKSSSKESENLSDHYFPEDIKLSAQVYVAIKVLSAMIDALEGSLTTAREPKFLSPTKSLFNGAQSDRDSSMATLKDTTTSDIKSEIIHSMASIPALMKVILLVEDEYQRDFLMSTSLVQSILSHKASVGSWLTHMLQSGERRVVDRALKYVNLVSSDAFWSSQMKLSQSDQQKRHTKQTNALVDTKRAELYDQVSQLPNFVPSLISLGGRQIEEASTTAMVRRVLDRIIARPFCATFIFCDALFLAIMIIGFRMAVHRFIINEAPGNVLRYVYVANMGIFYFVIRELGKAVSLSMINQHARHYFLSFWNLSDLLATLLALTSTIAIRSHFSADITDTIGTENVPVTLRYLLTATTGILWLRVLSFLKGINMQLATFVLAILQISRDVIWFCVILVTLLVSFGQMFFTLMAPDTCGVEPDDSMCLQSEYYLKMYSMLIFQEFDRDSYDSFVSVVLVVIYSFMVALVLLNVLIAVASDSYEKCLVRSQNLFGRARVMMIAEMVSFQNLLRRSSGDVSALAIYKAWWSKDSASGWSRGSMVFFGLSSIVVLVWAIAETAGFFTGPGHGNMMMSLGSIMVTVFLFVCIMLFLSIGAGNESKLFERNGKKIWNGRLEDCASQFESLVHSFVLRLLGSSVTNSGTLGVSSDSTAADEWSGRIHFLKKEMNKIADEQRAATSEQVQNLGSSLREELAKLESSFATLKQEVSKPEAVAPEDVPAMLGVAIEALQKVRKTLR